MGRVTVYLDDETEKFARDAARAEGISFRKWVARRIQQRARSDWPEAVRALAGAWPVMPTAETIRETR